MPLISLSSEQARTNLGRDRATVWPTHPRDQGRLKGVATVEFSPSFTLQPGEAVFAVGSCFARNIEMRLETLGFELPTLGLTLAAEERGQRGATNNLLNKYTPFAILNEFRWALDPEAVFPGAAYLQVNDDLWSDPQAAPQIRPAALERVRERRAMMSALYGELKRCRVVVVTLGLVESWYDTTTGLHLNGPPAGPAQRREPDRFQLQVLSVAEIGQALEEIHDLLRRFGHPQFRMLLTVSPVPLTATMRGIDVITANTYSKSALRAAAEGFVLGHDDVDYFPSYEIVTHSERALTFGEDCRHVARPVVATIVDRMAAAYVPGAEIIAEATPGPISEPEPDAAEDGDRPPADRTRKRVSDAVHAKNFVKAIKVLAPLEANGWQGAGYSELDYRLDYGRALLFGGQVLEADAQFNRANELSPDSVPVLLNMARSRRQLSRRREAEACLARAVELSPDDGQIHYLLAVDMARDGRHDQAAPHLARCLVLLPRHERAQALFDECRLRLATAWDAVEAEADEADAPASAPPAKATGLRGLAKGLFRKDA